MIKHLETHWGYCLAAVMFYSRIPVPRNAPHSDKILNRSRLYFPLIGCFIGLIAVTVFAISNVFLPTTLCVLLSIVASVLATGALHEDGFADSCDGFGGGWSAEQVLHIMKDSRVGSYATIGLLLLLGLKFFSLLEITKLSLVTFSLIYISAHVFSRLCSSLLIEHFSYVQDIELSKVKPMTDRPLPRRYLFATILLGIAPVAILISVTPLAIIATALSALAPFATGYYSYRRIGGYTGDVLGAAQQLSEVVFYLSLIPIIN